jgi:two-component system, cell cycle sensor histidine kinase and response regulator CckA
MPDKAWILVVDDEDAVLKLMGTVLQLAGFQVTLASDAHSGLSHCQIKAPDLLITDVLLHPAYTGCEMARHLRVTYPDLMTLYVSGSGESELLEGELAQGHAAFLPKPFSPSGLIEAVHMALECRHAFVTLR